MTQKQQWKRAMIFGSAMAVVTGALGVLGDLLLQMAFN
jgi:hypothetical protein